MSSNLLFLDVHGVHVEISANLEGSRHLEAVAEDFSYFRIEARGTPELRILLGQSNEVLQKKLHALAPAFRTRMCGAHGWGNSRVCNYGEGVLVFVNRGNSSGREVSVEVSLGEGGERSADLAYEAIYSVLLSALGECLDRRGFHRVHALALAGVAGEQKSALVLLPSGGGKSAMAALLVAQQGYRIFSDESPLLHDGKVYPFPLRGALRPEVASALGIKSQSGRRFKRRLFPEKVLIPFDSAAVAEAAPVSWVLIGKKSDQANIKPDPSARLAAYASLVDSAVVGRGLAQMSEYMIRRDSLWNLPMIAWSRLQSSRVLLENAKVGWFEVSGDAHQNAETLARFLE